jgi:hypothetical protein
LPQIAFGLRQPLPQLTSIPPKGVDVSLLESLPLPVRAHALCIAGPLPWTTYPPCFTCFFSHTTHKRVEEAERDKTPALERVQAL